MGGIQLFKGHSEESSKAAAPLFHSEFSFWTEELDRAYPSAPIGHREKRKTLAEGAEQEDGSRPASTSPSNQQAYCHPLFEVSLPRKQDVRNLRRVENLYPAIREEGETDI